MTRRCSHCSNNGHNSRTCPSSSRAGTGLKLFGVRLTDGGSIIKKSASMGNLSALHYHSSSSAAASPIAGSPSSESLRDPIHLPDSYLSDDPARASCSANRRAERKKGIPWTEEEHRLFLLGLQKLGKGDWRGISRNFVVSRTPTQVASHAQKYLIRQSNATQRKRRSSLFDMVSDMVTEPPHVLDEQFMLPLRAIEMDKMNSLPSLNLSLKTDYESMEDGQHEMVEDSKESVASQAEIPPVIPSFFPAYLPIPFPFWPSNAAIFEEEKGAETPHHEVPFLLWPSNAAIFEEEKGVETSHHEVLKPIPVFLKEPVNVDELVGMSQLSMGETDTGLIEPSPLSIKLLGEPSRQSAFHPSTPATGSEVNKGNNSVIQAV